VAFWEMPDHADRAPEDAIQRIEDNPGMIRHVTDRDDPSLEDFRDIQDRDRRGPDGRPGVFIGEQTLVVEKMLTMPQLVRRILVSETRRDWLEAVLSRHDHPAVECLVAPQSMLESIAGFPIHRGVIASGDRSRLDGRSIDDVIPSDPDADATLLVCESIRNIDNIGMLFRTAAAFGVTGVILSPDCHDPLYRKSLRVSIGHALSIPFTRSEDLPADLGTARDRGFELVGASIAGRVDVPETSDPGRRRNALVVGSEFDGLSDATSAMCDRLLRIGMARGVDSLNVAVASAVLLDRLTTAPRV